jgi:hypothetical protein
LDLHDIAAHFLAVAVSGASATRMAELESSLRTEEVSSVLTLLLSNKLLEIGEQSVYWTTTDGVKFLDIHFNMERMLIIPDSLV